MRLFLGLWEEAPYGVELVDPEVKHRQTVGHHQGWHSRFEMLPGKLIVTAALKVTFDNTTISPKCERNRFWLVS
jgi:hypothetical protein